MKDAETFPNNFILVDHENVQPKNLALLSDECFQIYIFVGAKQTTVNIDLVKPMQEFGPDRCRYIQFSQSGPNALDFYITYYLGVLAAQNPKAYFHIISKDKGFDPLIDHLTQDGLKVYRRNATVDIPIVRTNPDAGFVGPMDLIIRNLKGRGQCKPRKEKTLKNTIRTMFPEDLEDRQVDALFSELQKLGIITVNNSKVSYTFPAKVSLAHG